MENIPLYITFQDIPSQRTLLLRYNKYVDVCSRFHEFTELARKDARGRTRNPRAFHIQKSTFNLIHY